MAALTFADGAASIMGDGNETATLSQEERRPANHWRGSRLLRKVPALNAKSGRSIKTGMDMGECASMVGFSVSVRSPLS